MECLFCILQKYESVWQQNLFSVNFFYQTRKVGTTFYRGRIGVECRKRIRYLYSYTNGPKRSTFQCGLFGFFIRLLNCLNTRYVFLQQIQLLKYSTFHRNSIVFSKENEIDGCTTVFVAFETILQNRMYNINCMCINSNRWPSSEPISYYNVVSGFLFSLTESFTHFIWNIIVIL